MEKKPKEDKTVAPSLDVSKDWKLGVALWTFHRFNFQEALEKADSTGVAFIEPYTFHRSGPILNDSLILQLSHPGLAKLGSYIKEKGFQAESMYCVGDSTVESWKRQFELAQQFGVRFVTAEPPIELWDEIDSLAGAYGIKVAIHNHWKGTSQYWNPETVIEAIKEHPNFGACADLGHWPKSGINPLDAIKMLSGHILAVHLKDIAAYNDPELKDVPAGTGVIDFSAIFNELKQQQFRGPIYIERDAEDLPSNLASVIQTVEYYNELVNELD